MLVSTISAVLGLIAFAITTTTSLMVCNEDNCLRAIQASAFPTRPGTADCSSYFLDTVTPATVTITHTSTVLHTGTAVSDVTATTTLDVTVTSVVDVTAETTELAEVTVAGAPTEITVYKRRNEGITARQVTVSPSNIPTYASACSGSVRYSSACSCIGLTAHTTTAAALSTTTIKTVTTTTIVTTLLSSIATDTATITDATILLTTTVTTDTLTAFTTVTLPPVPTFILKARYGSVTGKDAIISPRGTIDSESPSMVMAGLFTLNAAGHLMALSDSPGIANVDLGGGQIKFNPAYDIANPLVCSLVSETLVCAAGDNTQFQACDDNLRFAAASDTECPTVVLTAVAPPS